jgi:predicted RNase H-like HicB family nuclease
VVAVTAYRVRARHVGDWWALEVPDLPGVFSQAKRLDKAEAAACEAIAVMLDVEPEAVRVEIEPEVPENARAAVRDLEEARRARTEAADREQQAAARAAAALTKELSQRDAGRLLGLSFQRVSQLAKSARSAARSGNKNRCSA